MSILTSFAGLDWAEKIGITLIHSFWQIALVAIVYALATFLLQLRSAHMRYIAGCCALSAMLVAPVSTYLVLSCAQPDVASQEVANLTGGSSHDTRGSESEPIPNPAGEASTATIPTESTPSAAPDTSMVEADASIIDPAQITPVANTSEEPPVVDLTEALRSCLPWATAVWIIGVIVLALRPLWGWLHILRLRRHGLSPLPDALQNAGQRTMRRLGVLRAVRFVQSAIVEVPTVVGFLRPIVLLPASVVSGFSTEEIELILTHELAHVRRNDWMVNLAQIVIEALLFYHPAMWWVSGQIHAERENCCDDTAVATEGRRAAYVRALARLEELRGAAPVAMLTASGGSLITRVRRLSGNPASNCGHRRFGVCLAGPTILAIAAMAIVFAMATGGTEGKPMSDDAQQQETSYQPDADSEIDAPAAPKSSREPTFKLTVLDAEGNPVPHAKVNHSRVDRDKKRTYYSRTADEHGIVVLDTTEPENIGWFSFSVKTAGYAPFYGQWDNWDSNDMPPKEFTVRLKKGKTIGGVVKNEEGEPVEGVKVSFSFPYGAEGMRRDDRTGCAAGGTTDAEGRWTCGYVPLNRRGTHRFTLNHPDYKTCQFRIALSELVAGDNGEFTKVMMIAKGNAISGTVRDAFGSPLADASVFVEFLNMTGTEKDCIRQTKTDQAGKYRFENCPLGPVAIVARSPGNAIQTKSCDISKQPEPVDITMKPGEPLSLRVVNREGRPIEGAYFYVRTWQGSSWIKRKLLSRDNDRTDVEGRFTWTDAPQEEIRIEVYAEDHMRSEALSVRAGEDEHVFELHPSLDISGAVTDKLSGKPIPKFTVTPGIFFSNMPERIHWQPEKARDHQGGQYATRQKYPYAGYAIRIEAESYIPQESRKIEISEGAVTLDFALKKADEEYLQARNELNRSRPRGVVLTPDGKPAGWATLGFANSHMGAYIRNGVLSEESHRFFTHADGQGEFAVPQLKPKDAYPSAHAKTQAVAEEQPYMMVVLHDSGFAYLDYDEIKRRTEKDATAFDSPIQLQKWARVEGRLMFSDKPAVQCPVNLQVERPISTEASNAARRPSHIWYDYKTTTDHQGQFVFDLVPPGMTGTVARTISFARDGGSTRHVSSHAVPVVFNPGKTTQVQIGGEGRPVTGQLRYADGFPNQVDWKFALVRMKRDLPPALPPAILADAERYPLCSAVDSKGRFRVEDVPQGDWVLSVEITNPRSRTDRSAPSRLLRQEFPTTIPEAPDGRPNEPDDIGVLTLSQSTD